MGRSRRGLAHRKRLELRLAPSSRIPWCLVDTCDDSRLTPPIFAYDHAEGCSITGGVVYREARSRCWGALLLWRLVCGAVRSSRQVADGAVTDEHDWTTDLGQVGQVRSRLGRVEATVRSFCHWRRLRAAPRAEARCGRLGSVKFLVATIAVHEIAIACRGLGAGKVRCPPLIPMMPSRLPRDRPDVTVEDRPWVPVPGGDDGIPILAFVDGVRRIDVPSLSSTRRRDRLRESAVRNGVGAVVWRRQERHSTIERPTVQSSDGDSLRWPCSRNSRPFLRAHLRVDGGPRFPLCPARWSPHSTMPHMRRAEAALAEDLGRSGVTSVVADGPL